MLPTRTFDSTKIILKSGYGYLTLLPSINECMSNIPVEVARSKALFALKEYHQEQKSLLLLSQECSIRDFEIRQKEKQNEVPVSSLQYILVEVTSVEIDDLNKLPGVHCKHFFERMSTEKLFKIAGGSKITFISTLAAINITTHEIFTTNGFCFGTLVEPVGTKGFGWDSIFKPEGKIIY